MQYEMVDAEGMNALTPKMDNPTVGENIDRKIKYHQMEIERLEKAKGEMQPLLHMRIGDMREVMSY